MPLIRLASSELFIISYVNLDVVEVEVFFSFNRDKQTKVDLILFLRKCFCLINKFLMWCTASDLSSLITDFGLTTYQAQAFVLFLVTYS